MMTTWNAVSTLDRMLDDVMGSAFGAATNARTFEPTIDVRTNDDEIAFVCDVPGMKRDDLEITLENHTLTLQGTRRFDRKEGERVVLGRAYGTFKRVYTLPSYVDEANLTAQLDDGVLTIRIPKHAKAKPRKIAIAGASDAERKLEP